MKNFITTLVVVSCACAVRQSAPDGSSRPEPAMGNPLLQAAWKTPHGTPPFDRIEEKHFPPAFDQGMKQRLAEIEAIAGSPEPPTFENTIEALERAGALYARAERIFDNLTGANTNDILQAIEKDYAGKRSRHADQLFLNAALFARIETLHQRIGELGLTAEQSKLLRDYHRAFVRRGARLDAGAKGRLEQLNARLAELHSTFGDNVRRENAAYALVIDDPKDLAGLPMEVVAAAAATAKNRGHDGKWAFTLVRSSKDQFLKFAANRDLRRQIHQAYVSRGAHGDDRDNREILKEIATLRAEKAALLGYPTWAHYNIDRNMAKTPEAVSELLGQLWPRALAKAKRERAMLTELLQKDLGATAKLEPWDWRYYAEKVRKAQYDLSENQLKPYFQVDAVRQGAFATATRLWGVTFREITTLVQRYAEDVKVFEVLEADGAQVGILYVDYHPRAGKSGGAWMSNYREQSNIDGRVRPIIVNVGNFPAPAGDKPALLGWDEVETLFHEFGHALQGLLSDVTYESQSGTNVKRDYVELCSQLLENWASDPSVIKEYARHYETGEPIPDELVDRLHRAATFNQGFATTEVLAATLLDLAWHRMTADEVRAIEDVQAFDEAAMKKIGLIPEIPPRYHAPYFSHAFSSDGYSANYYVYTWAEVLEADAFHAFVEKGDPFDPELAAKLRKYIFGAGSSAEEMDLYVRYRGKEPSVEPLMEKNGLVE
jgi:peptidyl-dipeptidase Dcp